MSLQDPSTADPASAQRIEGDPQVSMISASLASPGLREREYLGAFKARHIEAQHRHEQ